MDEMITRIVEIERQCSADIEQARLEYAKNIAAHQIHLEEKKASEFSRITTEENTRLTQTIIEAKKQIEAASAAFRRDSESLFQNPDLNEAIKKDMISILLGS